MLAPQQTIVRASANLHREDTTYAPFRSCVQPLVAKGEACT